MSFSFFAHFACVNAWTCAAQNCSLSSDRCTVAWGCFRWLPLASLTGYRQRNCARGLQLQLLQQVFDDRNALRVCSFSWIGQEPAFYKHCWNSRLSQDIVATAAHSAI